MRNRIIIVVLGLSLGLGARFGLDLYHRYRNPPPPEATTPAATSQPGKATEVPRGK